MCAMGLQGGLSATHLEALAHERQDGVRDQVRHAPHREAGRGDRGAVLRHARGLALAQCSTDRSLCLGHMPAQHTAGDSCSCQISRHACSV